MFFHYFCSTCSEAVDRDGHCPAHPSARVDMVRVLTATEEREAKAEREAARQEYIRMLRDVANAVEADPTAFQAAAVQVRDTSAVVCDAFEKGGA